MNKFLMLLFILSITIYTGCYYDVEEELYPTGCDTVDVSYANEITPIINNNCINCHSKAANQGNITLEGYEEILKYANGGSLLGSVKQIQGFAAMPQGAPKINDCSISKIESWIKAGSPNN